jgi:hypothetical protein
MRYRSVTIHLLSAGLVQGLPTVTLAPAHAIQSHTHGLVQSYDVNRVLITSLVSFSAIDKHLGAGSAGLLVQSQL